MNKSIKRFWASAAMSFFALSLAACTGNGQNQNQPIDDKPSQGDEDTPAIVVENLVLGVTLMYNNAKVTTGVIQLDVSQKSVNVSCDVKTVGNPSYTIEYSIENNELAEIDANGKITIKKAGETVLTATAGDVSHSVVLVIGDQYAPLANTYTVTVEGGFANVYQAKPGDHIYLKVDLDTLNAQHRDFIDWSYYNTDTNEELTDLWINGSIFRMPECNVTVRANTKVKLYKLGLVDASIIHCSTEEGTDIPEYIEEDDAKVYSLPYAAEVTIKANAEKEGEMFVGFDVGSYNNRKGELGKDEYSFIMSDENFYIFAEYADIRNIPFGSASALSSSGIKITNGILNEETEADPDLRGYSGYRFTFNSSASPVSDFPNGGFTSCGDFSTLKHGSQTIRTIYKNHSDQAFAVEMFAEQYGTIAASGTVAIPAHGVVVHQFIASAGFHNPSFGLVLRQGCTGGSDSSIPLDVVFVSGDTYPNGDPQFAVPEAEYVTLKQLGTGADFPAGSGIRGDCFESGPNAASSPGQPTTGSFGGRKNTNNQNGITNMLLRDGYMKYSSDPAQYPYIYSYANNVPDYDENDTVTVYFRVNNTSNNTGKFIFGVGNSTSVLTDSTRVSVEIELQPYETTIFGITYKRHSAEEQLIISLVRPKKGTYADFNIIIQMMYNNKIGCLDENIYKA